MAQYKTGTVSVTNGSATVTGSGTAFSANLTAGNLFTVEGDSVAYTVASAPTTTSLTLTAPYGGTTGSGKTYGVTIDFTPDLGLPLMSIGDLNTAAIYNEAMKNIDNLNLDDLGTAAFSDIKGTVSQSGGVPTGAIIESGSNASGYYTKFADGTLLVYNCRHTAGVTTVVTGSLSRVTITIPAPVTSTIPFTVNGGGNNSSGDGWVGPSATKTGANLTFVYWTPIPTPTVLAATDIIISAIGRWY